MSAPMHHTLIMRLDDSNKKVDHNLLKLGIMFGACLFAYFQFDTRDTHFTTIKMIFKYLKNITNLGLYFKKFDEYMLIGYYDADYVIDIIEKESICGRCHFTKASLISWASKRQDTIIMSTTEVKYIVATHDFY
ncbi:hypothetical protein CR513_28089, partial [Mucuna pruriens]